MALDELAATIETIKSRINEHRTSLAANETRTRQVLIDPLLSALGWDVSDPNQVELEYDVRGKRADYALKSNGQVVGVIEAKSLRSPLEERETRQALTYANESAIAYMAVTDGDTWRMYDVFAVKPIEDRIIMEFSISLTPTHLSALRSLSMWRANIGSDSGPALANEPVLGVEDTGDGPDSPIDEQEASQTSNEGWIQLDKARYNARDPRPTRIRLPDQSEIRIASWKNVWISIAEWMVEREPQMTACRFGNTKPTVIKAEDEGFWAQGGYQLSNGLWIEPGVTGNTLLRTARSFLEYFNVEPSSVSIKFD